MLLTQNAAIVQSAAFCDEQLCSMLLFVTDSRQLLMPPFVAPSFGSSRALIVSQISFFTFSLEPTNKTLT